MTWIIIYTAVYTLIQAIFFVFVLRRITVIGRQYRETFGDRRLVELSADEQAQWESMRQEHQRGFSFTLLFTRLFILFNAPLILIQSILREDKRSNFAVTFVGSYVMYLGIVAAVRWIF